ncbi:unnamed protein product [Paramecium octaurelia]|uniref:Uncharacterized protein n=1 Tax=Paramecium octaurelia TaxID=43137 RepID=A0A8S1VJB5_PAROT|nr:unnamed protein product [Paramecium octaurelia]
MPLEVVHKIQFSEASLQYQKGFKAMPDTASFALNTSIMTQNIDRLYLMCYHLGQVNRVNLFIKSFYKFNLFVSRLSTKNEIESQDCNLYQSINKQQAFQSSKQNGLFLSRSTIIVELFASFRYQPGMNQRIIYIYTFIQRNAFEMYTLKIQICILFIKYQCIYIFTVST